MQTEANDPPIPRLRSVDITAAARPWRMVRIVNYVTVVICGNAAAFLIWTLISGGDLPPIVSIICLTIFCVNAALGWLTVETIDFRLQRLYLLALIPLGMLGIVFILLGSLSVASIQHPVTEDEFKGLWVLLGFGGIFAISTLLGLFGLVRVRRARIGELGLSLREMVAKLHSLATPRNLRPAIVRRNKWLGRLYIVLGVGWLVGLYGIPESLFSKNSAVPSMLPLLGWVLLLSARSNYQPKLSDLLTHDARPPILFLRSFADDKRKRNMYAMGYAFIDFSLESRLAYYFRAFGPCIAVKAPGSHGLELGASQAALDGEWHDTVKRWMQSASTILLFVGTSPGVNWEFKTAIAEGVASKLIVLWPQPKQRWLWWRRRRDAADRFASLRADLSETRWSNSLVKVFEEEPRYENLRAIILEQSGSAMMIRSRARNRDSYHLAAMVAHYLQLAGAGVPIELKTAGAAQ